MYNVLLSVKNRYHSLLALEYKKVPQITPPQKKKKKICLTLRYDKNKVIILSICKALLLHFLFFHHGKYYCWNKTKKKFLYR